MGKVIRPRMLNEKKPSPLNCFLTSACILLFAVVFINLWFNSTFLIVEVTGASMENTLFDGDVLYADRTKTPERGDVVIIDVASVNSGVFRGEFIIKRIIALAGDTVKCEGGRIFLRKAGEREFFPLEEEYVDFPTGNFEEVTPGEGEIFFLGDHRTNSTDSRAEEVGCLEVSRVVAVVPQWAISNREAIKRWETFRSLLTGRTRMGE